MTDAQVFLSGVGGSALVALGVAIYLRPHLKSILSELCGTSERARFWVAFSNVALVLFPLIFALNNWPDRESRASAILEIGTQLKWALIGLVAAVLVLGFVIGSFIARSAKPPAAPGKANG